MLQNCSSNIEKLCTPSVSVNQTCNSTTTSFNNDFKTCIKEKTNNEYCACIDVLDFNPVKDCKKTINDNFRDSNKEKKACIKEGFAPCKKAIPVVLEAALICKSSASTTSTSTSSSTKTSPYSTTTSQYSTSTTTTSGETPILLSTEQNLTKTIDDVEKYINENKGTEGTSFLEIVQEELTKIADIDRNNVLPAASIQLVTGTISSRQSDTGILAGIFKFTFIGSI